MDILDKDSKFWDPMRPLQSNMSNSIHPSRKPGHGFLEKLFSRQPSQPKLITEIFGDRTLQPGLNRANDSSQTESEVTPCPYIHPLGNRLEPRIESKPLTPRRKAEGSGRSMLCKRQEASYAACSLWPPNKAYDVSRANISASHVMSIRGLMRRENIASTAAADASYLNEWYHYIKCYSEGRYSMTAPPIPPPKSSYFTYLPSTYPPNELERLATFQSSKICSGSYIEWSNLEIEEARSLITAAIKIFATPWAAISFFDRDSEVVQAERGYSRHLIPRHESIASHVLLTDDVMTVLDTQKDWRFSCNPLVIGNPNIRFFAGAPLFSANSHVIGVFSIFSPVPRTNFTAVQRRDLQGLGELATRKLMARGDLPPTVGLQVGSFRGSATNLHEPMGSPLLPLETNSCRNTSVAVRYHKASQNDMQKPGLVIVSEGQDTHLHSGVHTAPGSDDSGTAPSPVSAELKCFGKNHKQLSLAVLQSQPPNDMRPPESPTFSDLSPNSDSLWSEAFLTDLDNMGLDSNPYRADYFYMHDTAEPNTRFGVRGRGFSSDYAADILTPHPNSPVEHVSDTFSLSINSKGRETLLEEALLFGERADANFTEEHELVSGPTSELGCRSTNSSNHEATHRQERIDMKSGAMPDLRSKIVHASVGFQAEARFAAEFWAKNLGLDAIYAIELIPKGKSMRTLQLIAPGDVETRILVAYGLPDTINFDIPVHLNVLRGSGAFTWHDKNATSKEYSRGFMMSLLFENGALDNRSSGVVFGAFRKRPEKLKSAEVERLQRVANVLEDILSKWPSLRQPSQS